MLPPAAVSSITQQLEEPPYSVTLTNGTSPKDQFPAISVTQSRSLHEFWTLPQGQIHHGIVLAWELLLALYGIDVPPSFTFVPSETGSSLPGLYGNPILFSGSTNDYEKSVEKTLLSISEDLDQCAINDGVLTSGGKIYLSYETSSTNFVGNCNVSSRP